MIKLLQASISGLKLYKDEQFSVDFTAEKKVFETEREEGIVSSWHKSIHTLNSLSFIGINASGKTTTLNILAEIITLFISNSGLEKDLRLARYFDSVCTMTNYFLVQHGDEKKLYKLVSTIQKDALSQKLLFSEEFLYEKKLNATMTRKQLFEFSDIPIMIRSEIGNVFLKQEDSMFSAILNPLGQLPLVQDLLHQTNFNYLSAYFDAMPLSFVQYFDDSIEFFRFAGDKSLGIEKFALKFKHDDSVHVIDVHELELYLSSGTIKGISLLNRALLALRTGGYLIIDEIENHLNKTIVVHFLQLFTSELNTKGAVLLFSTHYSEILDIIDRSDSIYVVHRQPSIQIEKFSLLAQSKDRIDKKKSDLILSGSVHSAPSYGAYRQLRKDLVRMLGEHV